MSSPNTKKVLISGINGYIASHIGLQLLQKGYKVQGASRSSEAGTHLLSDAYKGYESQYQHFEVKDITKKGAFDEAVKGVHGIIHTASPIDFTLPTLDDFLGPAINGNLSILDSAKRCAGSQLESFVLTSSVAAMMDRWRLPPDHHYSEEDWNESSEAVARKEFTAPVAYGASKTAAERALWRWQDENHPSFSCSSVNPGVVTGPPITWPATPDKLNVTVKPIWQLYSGEATSMPPPIGAASYIDVRDVAALHIWCMEHPKESNGERYLATNGKAPPQAAADLLREKYPNREIMVGEPGVGYVEGYGFPSAEPKLPSTKAYKAMGVENFMSYDRSVLDTVEAFEKRWPGLAKNLKQ